MDCCGTSVAPAVSALDRALRTDRALATRLVDGLPAPPARPAAGPVDRVSLSAEGLARAAESHASTNVPADGEPTDPERVHAARDRAPVGPRLGAYGGRPDANLDLAPALDLFG